MNEEHREIHNWLVKVFGSESIPQFEINERTLEILRDLKRTNEREDHHAQLNIEDFNQKTAEYRVEASRQGNVLKKVGLSHGSLSQSGTASLRSLTSVALLLELKDVSDSSYLTAQSRLIERSMQLTEQRKSEQRISDILFNKTKAALLKSSSLKKELSVLDEQEVSQSTELEKKAKQTGFLQNKTREYKSQIQKLKEELARTGVDPSIYHSALVQKQQKLDDLNEELKPLKTKLNTYHSLPPNKSLAKVKLEELKREVARLENELSQKMDLMHV